jgi:Glycoside-hydrolase family GH114
VRPNIGGRLRPALFFKGLCAIVLATGCSVNGQQTYADSAHPAVTPADSVLRLPDRNAGFDYQLGGAYAPPPRATIIERDRTDKPSGAGYDICYVNGFQTQPADSQSFAKQHPELVLQAGGKPLIDQGWPDEYLFDTSTEPKRSALAAIVKPWIDGCKAAGYSAVEIDNLDSYTRSGASLTAHDNIAMAAKYAQMAHQAGLAIAQKNAAEESRRLRDAGYDFAISESCVRYSECSSYTAQYPVVLDIEYTDELGEDGFASACNRADRAPVMIMRDHNLVTPADGGYFYRGCNF